MWLYPFGYSSFPKVPNRTGQKRLAKAGVKAIRKVNGRKYRDMSVREFYLAGED